MNKNFNINGKIYELNCNIKENDELRRSFNNLTEKTYGFNFENWYENGYWGDLYIPYSLIFENKVVSNVSVNIMEFLVLGEKKRYIQIGTVMTDEIYYIKEYNAVVACSYENDTLYIKDVFTSQQVKLEDIISIVMKEEIKNVILGFTPIDTSLYCKNLLIEDDTTLFVSNRNCTLLEDNDLMFPILSHA